MPSIDQLLSRVVERKGYTVQGADQEALFARKGEEALLAAWKLDGPLNAADAQMFLTACEQVRAASGILVAVGGVDAAARDLLAANKAVDLWAESRLVMEVGDAFVKDALDAAPRTAPATPAGAPARLPSTPGTNVPSGANAFQATREVAAGNKPSSKFPSLIAQAAGASVVSNAGAAYYMPSKPKAAPPADMQAHIPQKAGGSLGYAWGGGGGMGAGTSNPGIAQVRSGRNPRLKTDQWGNLIDPNTQPATAAAPASQMIVPADDVEIISTPRRGAQPAAPAPTQAPAPRAPAPQETEAYEIITTKKPAAKEAVKAATPGSGVLRLNVTKEDALAKAGAKPGSTVRLALVPHVAFEYDLNMTRPGMAQPITAKGALLLSSLTGELRAVDGLAYADAAPADARKEQEKLQAVDLYDKVKSHMAKTYSRTLNVEREVAGVTMTETLKLVPDPDECGLEHKGMVGVPVWEVVTSTGVVKVDAYAGAVLSG